MKKLLLSFAVILTASNISYSQVVDYYVPVGDLIGMTVQTGDMCFDPAEYKQAAVGNTWGFQWTSTGTGSATSVDIDFISVLEEGAGPYPATLNASAVTAVSPTASSCGFTGQLFSVDPTNYNVGGVNTFLMDYSASTWTNQLYPVTGFYAHIAVNYGTPCTNPDVPTLTATSPICPSASSTITIAGNLNDATSWEVYTGSCGGTSIGNTTGTTFVVSPATTTTYYIRGEGGCVTPGSCGSITITVEDNTAPVPDNGTLADVNAECSATPTAPTATDDCAGAVTASPDVTFPITTQGTTTVTWTYDDGNGNLSTQTQDVILDDNTAPVPDNGSLTAVFAECSAAPTAPTATDNCAGTVTASPDVTFPITTQGTTTITWTYNDGNGNTSTQTQDVILNDVTPPVADNSALSDVTAECSASPTAPTATDNCAGTITATPDVTFPITTQGTTTVTWTYDDGNGNTSSQTQDVILDDVTDPVISQCPGNSSFPADNAGCTAQILWLEPVATDNCGSVTLAPDIASGSTFNLGTTTVTYTATDGAGNTATCSFDITITSDLDAVATTVTNIDCNGNTNGSIDVTTSGGGTPYSFDWNSGTYTTEDISGLSAGTYDLTVTDDFGCTDLLSVSVTEPTAISATIVAATNPTSCGAADGSVDVSSSGGTGTLTYDWNSGAFTTEDISGLSAGNYTLMITDDNGCTTSLDTALSDPGSPTITIASVQNASCLGASDGSIDINVTGGTVPYTFDWDNDGTGDNDDTEDLLGLTAGNYNLTLTDDAGCTSSLSQAITEPGAIDISVTQNGFDLTANATGVTYQWVECPGMTAISGETAATFSATNNGDYAVIITDGACADTSACYTIEGVGLADNNFEFNIYPNPTSDNLFVTFSGADENAKIRLVDMTGKNVLEYNAIEMNGNKNTLQFNVGHLEDGTYMLQLLINDNTYSKLIVIQ